MTEEWVTAEDDWVPVAEPITNEQVEALLRLLSLPVVEGPSFYFADDD